ncbi:MAG: single-stranded-DNA-specific exonuclease RecJ [Kiritimatiellia bacterium]
MKTENQKVWRDARSDPARAADIARALGFPLPVALALTARGILSPGAAENFLNPRLSSLRDPFCLPGMPEAVTRICSALERGERIVVFGDYDADGVTAVALVFSVLRQLGGNVNFFLPDRFEHGYGLTRKALEKCLNELKPDLILTVDCGTNCGQSVALARRMGTDVVITDHHCGCCEKGEAVAVVNPSSHEDEALRDLAGVGVAFKLCHALIKQRLTQGDPRVRRLDLRGYLDLVAIGTVADVAALRGENRILVRHGLMRLNEANGSVRRVGLEALLETAGLNEPLDAHHVGFVIAPRLNAVGRLGSAEDALQLLLAERPEVGREFALRLEQSNRLRREIEEQIFAQSMQRIAEGFDMRRHFGLVVSGPDWHIGILGIVAARLCATYRRPVVVVSEDGGDGMCRGSARSTEQLDILAALNECRSLLAELGGHSMAAGVLLKKENLDAFRKRFNEVCTARLAGQNLVETLEVDAWMPLSEATLDFYGAIEKLKPFGVGNRRPLWGTRKVQVIGIPRVVGSKHLKLRLASGGTEMEAIAFGMVDHALPDGDLDILYHLRLNTFGGRPRVEVEIQDFRPHVPETRE